MPENHMVIRLGAFGDVMLTTGVLNYWRKTRGSRFHVITRAGFSAIFNHHPAVDRIISVNPENLTATGWWDFCRRLERDYSSMKLVDLHGNLRTAFLRRIWSGKVCFYPKMALSRRLYARTGATIFKDRLLEKNVPQRYASALSKKMPDRSILTPRLYLKSNEILDAKKRLADLGLGNRIVCLHPYATHQAKAWPYANWKQLIILLESKGIDWVIIGQNTPSLFPEHPRDLTNQTSIRETGAIISRCRALITGDSGPMHLGSAVNTRVIGLFGPTSREWGFYPAGPQDIILEPDIDCRPCSLHGQSRNKCNIRCMNLLEPKQVLSALMPGLYSPTQT